jgi:hypothetical protein
MGDFFILESAHHMVDAVHVTDIAQEVVSQALSLGSSTHNTSDINNLQDCCNL